MVYGLSVSQFKIEILSKPDDVSAFVEQAQRASDTDKEALGFLPERAYKEAAYQGKLLIAVVQDGGNSVYAGHLLYGGVFPRSEFFKFSRCLSFAKMELAVGWLKPLCEEQRACNS